MTPSLPESFVYLKDIDPSIRQSVRYGTSENFVGEPVDGYETTTIILTKEVATALQEAQKHFQKKGFDIVVYDAYRPQQAVNHFIRWSDEKHNQRMKPIYYPRIQKEKVFEEGFIARRSAHSRGSAVDLTLIPRDQELKTPSIELRQLSDGFQVVFLDDGTLDMGASFDLFDEASWTETTLISAEHQANRHFLKKEMESFGFENYRKEWWHFSLKNEPFPETYFDFAIR